MDHKNFVVLLLILFIDHGLRIWSDNGSSPLEKNFGGAYYDYITLLIATSLKIFSHQVKIEEMILVSIIILKTLFLVYMAIQLDHKAFLVGLSIPCVLATIYLEKELSLLALVYNNNNKKSKKEPKDVKDLM